MSRESAIPPALQEVMLDEMYGKKFASFRFGGENYTVRRSMGAYLDGGFHGVLQIFNDRNEVYAGFSVDPWDETDEKIMVCSKYEHTLDIMRLSRSSDDELQDSALRLLPFSFKPRIAETANRTVEQHLDVLGRAILETVDQSPKPMYWYTFGEPIGMREEYPVEVYERLMQVLPEIHSPLGNRIKVYVHEDPEEKTQRNFYYVVEKFSIDAAQIQHPAANIQSSTGTVLCKV